ncbi:uncharacterized protein ASPGLDRAFT_26578 [Aspergillus glaucus CBS 516.65]|uniref:Uncharacterized protein n=1 Tax=Aspergillus glaucus CBS 516.65 TaxID=1160497 RepID=A0A1L9VGA5_ASPGL|nr:hypothetical protein ASPGLDRAFT_26578 [Aspergillus glaucus CBS 516.65]OJJ82946.1 hypothetical protein ASPGLDRAFT_26578 [Aspergillus glaucus CBS 516.65]
MAPSWGFVLWVKWRWKSKIALFASPSHPNGTHHLQKNRPIDNIDRDRFPESTGPALISYPAPDSLTRPRGCQALLPGPAVVCFEIRQKFGGGEDKTQTVVGAFGEAVPLRRDSGSIGSTGEGVPGSTAVGNRSDLPMGTLGGFGEFYPWLRELGEKINSKDEGILHDAIQSTVFFLLLSILNGEITCDRKHAVWR